jgi:hypothetical protein
MGWKSTTSKRSSTNEEEAVDINTLYDGQGTLRPTTCGSLSENLKTAKRSTDGRLVGQRKRGSFFPLGFLMHLSILVDVVFDGSSCLDFSLLPPNGTQTLF